MSLWLCLRFELLPLEALLTQQGQPEDTAVIIAAQRRVLICDERASLCGVLPEQSISTAQALLVDTQHCVIERSRETEEALLEQLSIWAYGLSPHLQRWRDDALAEKWEKIRSLRRVVTGALEIERAEKRIGSSLQAAPTVYADSLTVAAMDGIDLAEISITSAAELIEGAAPEDSFSLPDIEGIAVVPGLAEGKKCARCWQVLPDVGTYDHIDLCARCSDTVKNGKGFAE